MKLDIVIPTLQRERKLRNCITSIEKARKDNDVTVYLYFNNIEEIKALQELLPFFRYSWIDASVLIEEYRVPAFWNAHLRRMRADAMCYLNDDVILFPDTIDKLMESYQKHFPDYDGILGINQSNLTSTSNKEGAFGVIGKKYANRFPNKQVFCPEYYRFYADYEVELYAKSIDKFIYDKEVKIVHLHGSFYGEDKTHNSVRNWLITDRNIFKRRQKKKLLWGANYDFLSTRSNKS